MFDLNGSEPRQGIARQQTWTASRSSYCGSSKPYAKLITSSELQVHSEHVQRTKRLGCVPVHSILTLDNLELKVVPNSDPNSEAYLSAHTSEHQDLSRLPQSWLMQSWSNIATVPMQTTHIHSRPQLSTSMDGPSSSIRLLGCKSNSRLFQIQSRNLDLWLGHGLPLQLTIYIIICPKARITYSPVYRSLWILIILTFSLPWFGFMYCHPRVDFRVSDKKHNPGTSSGEPDFEATYSGAWRYCLLLPPVMVLASEMGEYIQLGAIQDEL
jgi:hypothetical protein